VGKNIFIPVGLYFFRGPAADPLMLQVAVILPGQLTLYLVGDTLQGTQHTVQESVRESQIVIKNY
jgi:hypothetical protein